MHEAETADGEITRYLHNFNGFDNQIYAEGTSA